MKIFSIIFIILVVLLGVTFSLLNGELVLVKYYIGEKQLPLSFVLIISLLIGVIIGLVGSLFNIIGLKLDNRALRKKLAQNDEEISKLRLLSIDAKD